MKTKSLIILLLLFSFFKSNAQEFKLGKVTIDELQEKHHLIDTTAVAAVLFNKARTFFTYHDEYGFSINTENAFRIKIYKKAGLTWATFKVPYRVGYDKLNNDKLEFTDCSTYNLVDGKIIKTKLNNSGIFKTVINKYWEEIAIALPNVKEGSVIEFKYTLQSENIIEFPVFNFQHDIPVNNSEYTTDIPGFFVYKAIAKRLSEIKFESKVTSGFLSFNNKNNPTRTESVNFQQATNIYRAVNVSALKEEPYVDNIENYRLSVHHELEKTQFYQEEVKDYATTWEGVAKTIYKEEGFGNELREREYTAKDLLVILKNIDDKKERLDVIFKFVQNKMNWNNKKGYLTDKGVKKAYEEGIGNTAEINFILIAMLNYAGITTHPVLLSTIDHGIPVFPTRTIFNYVIAAADIDGEQILLDATNKHTTNNILPLYTLNWNGRLLREDGSSEEIQLSPKFLSKKGISMMVTIDEGGKLSGRYKIQYSDYEAFSFREKYVGMNQQNYLEKVENEISGIQISNYKLENNKDFSLPIIEDFTFETDNHCEIIGNKMYLNPQLFFRSNKNPFVQEKRECPIYFGFPKQERISINIEIPKGYEVESLPKVMKIKTNENVASYIFNIASSGNSIQIMSVNEQNNQLVSPEFYDILKNFYRQLQDKQNEKIVLKKSNPTLSGF